MKKSTRMTIGCDLGDKYSELVIIDADGTAVERKRLKTTSVSFQRSFSRRKPATVVIEVGTHSPWVSQLLRQLGHEVIVANARQVQLIFAGRSKSDAADAELLARLARVDPKLLAPVRHRTTEHQKHLATIRARDAAVRARTLLINNVRGLLKPFGLRAPKCSSESFPRRVQAVIPAELEPALNPLLSAIEMLSAAVGSHEDSIKDCAKRFPDIELLTQVPGVGDLTATAFFLTVGEPSRFAKSRDVAAFFGLTPKKDQSGESDKQRRITKAGDPYVRRLLVQCAHYIMGRHGPDTDLKRFGLRMAERGGVNAKKRAIVAIARKLAVLPHRLWTTGEIYEPVRANS